MNDGPTADTAHDRSRAKGKRAEGPREAQLFLILECERPSVPGARVSLRGIRQVTVGRGTKRAFAREGEHLRIQVPDRWMSTEHARITLEADGWVVEDLGSRNGTFVNGERLARSEWWSDDVVELGRTLFGLREDVPVPADSVEVVDAELDGSITTLLASIQAQLASATRVAPTTLPVLLLGETGTGKEIVARSVHESSGRTGPFVAVNCGALPDTLLESQLFGHVKGAFSGATHDALGFVRSADQGTLFLDEVGDLSARSQGTLLRVIQEGEVVPVGATKPIRVDVRFIAATHRSLEAMCARGEFRQDLYARLAGLRLELPPLRERREDVGVLASALLRTIAKDRASRLTLSASAGRALVRYPWPLNVRELHQALSLAVALSADDCIEESHLPPAVAAAAAVAPSPILSAEDERLRAELLAHLEATAGNVSEVARLMGKARTQIHRWIRRFRIDPSSLRRR